MTKNLASRVVPIFGQLINAALAQDLPVDLRSDLPYLFIWGTQDVTTIPAAIKRSRNFISRYQDIALEGRGHWLMVEAKDEITENIVKWLEGLTCTRLEKL